MRIVLPLALIASAALAAPAAVPHLTFDARLLGSTATVGTLPAQKREEAPDFFPPRHLAVTFGPQDGKLRELAVYPVAGLFAQYPEAQGGARSEVETLRALLKARPAPAAIRGEMPFLPLPFAGQVLHAAVKYLDLEGGRGVRYLVAFSHDVSPLTREQVFYTFQGLTNDGKHYLSFQHDVSLRELPADFNSASSKSVLKALESGGSNVGATWNAYLKRTTRQLNALGNDARLTRLDAFVKSIRVR